MKTNDRLLAVWTTFAAYLLAPLVMLSVVFEWSSLVQVTLTGLMVTAASTPQLAKRARRRR